MYHTLFSHFFCFHSSRPLSKTNTFFWTMSTSGCSFFNVIHLLLYSCWFWPYIINDHSASFSKTIVWSKCIKYLFKWVSNIRAQWEFWFLGIIKMSQNVLTQYRQVEYAHHLFCLRCIIFFKFQGKYFFGRLIFIYS